MDRESKILYEAALLGEDATEFLESPLGKEIKREALEEIDEAQEEFIDADPEDAKKMRELQARIREPQKAIGWLIKRIIRGKEALQQLEEMKYEP